MTGADIDAYLNIGDGSVWYNNTFGNIHKTIAGTYTVYFTATTNLVNIRLGVYSPTLAAGTVDYDNISLVEMGDITGSGTLSVGTSTLTNLVVTNVSTSTFAGGLTVGTSQFVVSASHGKCWDWDDCTKGKIRYCYLSFV